MKKKVKKLAELAELVDGELSGAPDLAIHGLNDLDSAGVGEITFIVKANQQGALANSGAAAFIVPLEISEADKPLIRVKNPYLAAALIHDYFLSTPFAAAGISPKAHIGADCRIPAETTIAPLAVLGNRVTLGDRVTIQAGVVIGNDVTIGADTILKANVTVADDCRIGARVIIHSGTVVGSDGFGYATDEKGRHVKRHHVGTVVIEDEVEIGANVAIDRGTFGQTIIRRGAKIDNLVQIAHNVEVGENSLLVAQMGIAGSTTLGRNVVIGGQAGIKGHIKLDDGVMVASKAGVHNNQPRGSIVSGLPAIPHHTWLKASIIFAKLPQMFKELRQLKKKIAAFENDRDE